MTPIYRLLIDLALKESLSEFSNGHSNSNLEYALCDNRIYYKLFDIVNTNYYYHCNTMVFDKELVQILTSNHL